MKEVGKTLLRMYLKNNSGKDRVLECNGWKRDDK
jgi:hypothetical protein